MFLMNNDFFDSFNVAFNEKEGLVYKSAYPLGYFANEILKIDISKLREIKEKVASFKEEFNIFLNARSASSASMAHKELTELWSMISKISVYRLISEDDKKIEHLIKYMREHKEEVDDMITRGTERNQMLNLWLYNIENFVPSILNFKNNTDFMLENYFKELPSRSSESYIRAYLKYTKDIENGYDIAEQENESTDELDSIVMTFPFSLTFKPRKHPKTKKIFLAEIVTFGTLESFLYTDLMKGIAIGNVPRRCDNCNRYFLATGGYETVYCKEIAPNEKTKTCRDVGARKKEKEKNGSSLILAEYTKVYNRLKTRKSRGKITEEQWNEDVAKAQNLKAQALKGKISDASYLMKMGRI